MGNVRGKGDAKAFYKWSCYILVDIWLSHKLRC